MTQTGNTARLIAKYRPSMPILLVTATPEVAAQCQGYLKNCHCEVAPSWLANAESLVKYGIERSKETGWCKEGKYRYSGRLIKCFCCLNILQFSRVVID